MNELYLTHHGIKGQKWGIRRFQNKDGSYKPGAEGRYDPEPSSHKKQHIAVVRKTTGVKQENSKQPKEKKQGMSTAKKAAIGAAVVGGTLLAAYGTKKFVDVRSNKIAEELAVRALQKAVSTNSFREREYDFRSAMLSGNQSKVNTIRKSIDDDVSRYRDTATATANSLKNRNFAARAKMVAADATSRRYYHNISSDYVESVSSNIANRLNNPESRKNLEVITKDHATSSRRRKRKR